MFSLNILWVVCFVRRLLSTLKGSPRPCKGHIGCTVILGHDKAGPPTVQVYIRRNGLYANRPRHVLVFVSFGYYHHWCCRSPEIHLLCISRATSRSEREVLVGQRTSTQWPQYLEEIRGMESRTRSEPFRLLRRTSHNGLRSSDLPSGLLPQIYSH